MNDKEFTDELFQRMYDLGFNKAEIEDDVLFFFKNERDLLCPFSPRVMVACTCFEEKDQLIDVAEYLGIVDWSKVKVDTPILVSDFNEKNWERRHFAFFDNERVYAWVSGTTSWSTDNDKEAMSWKYAKLAEV
ncbi:hypothetical protein [Solobacterium sp.]|uniref:hypothetical protein n=1 Tax=Solobacterium sp. TaxID=2060878 RepID=UPI001CB226EA|nr:hypothetical protein [Solobacterium sp.]MBF1086503.1 hypothetical protein [Solobacterium sp.]